MNKKVWFTCILSIVISFVVFPSINVQATDTTMLSLSPYIDRVRDTFGRPLQNNTNYVLQVFETYGSKSDPYYIYDDYKGSYYNWLWLTKKSYGSGFSVQINNQSEVLTDGKQKYILNGHGGVGEVVRWQHDGTYKEGGLYWGYTGHNDRYGFRRITGDRDYKYLLTNNYGSILANFSSNDITTLGQDSIFLISFVRQ